MIDTISELMEYLDMRGAKYGIDGAELLNAIPESAREPKLAYEFMQLKDISHKVPLSKGGPPADDNWILEDSSVNRSRGDDTMTKAEEATAATDANADAQMLKRGALIGAGGAVGASVATAVMPLAVAAAPLLISTAAVVGGIAWLLKDVPPSTRESRRAHVDMRNAQYEKLGWKIREQYYPEDV